MPDSNATSNELWDLVDTLKHLRSPIGCPWDKEQTLFTLRRHIIEEAYELVEAISNNDQENICEEAGDLLLQVIFVSLIASEHNDFDLNDVIKQIKLKLIRRHPHVFANEKIANIEAANKNWDKIKALETKRTGKQGILNEIPKAFPALLKAYKIQEKAAKVGFDWPKGALTTVIMKLEEEILEMKNAILSNKENEIEEEMGDVLFSIVNLCRHLGLGPEETLNKANGKFTRRFNIVEEMVANSKMNWDDLELQELEEFWLYAKKIDNAKK